MEWIRLCPSCGSERPLTEMQCEGLLGNGSPCQWRLIGIPPTAPGHALTASPGAAEDASQDSCIDSASVKSASVKSASVKNVSPDEAETKENPTKEDSPHGEADEFSSQRLCLNGHPVSEDDFLCLQCSAPIAEVAVSTRQGDDDENKLIDRQIEGWTIREAIPSQSQRAVIRECFRVENAAGRPAFLQLYHAQFEPDPSIYRALEKADHDHIPDILLTGRWRGRPFEIIEWMTCGSLAESTVLHEPDGDALRILVRELGSALHQLAEVGLRHRSLAPHNILVRSFDPLDLVITDFSSARLSDFDLDTVAPLELTRYSAPEAIVGGVSAASDWWALGMIVLELCAAEDFAHINDKAFAIHIVTRGIDIPASIASPQRELLQGLLTRDPRQRWQWAQVQAWLNGEAVALGDEHAATNYAPAQKSFVIDQQHFHDAAALALALASEENCEQGMARLEDGSLATWLQTECGDEAMAASLRNLMAMENLALHWRYGLALMAMNQALPLVNAGNIVTPAWLLQHCSDAFALISGPVPTQLEAMQREQWLVNLHYRLQQIRERARYLEIELSEQRLRVTALVTSRANLEAERELLRELFPGSDHDSLAMLIEKPRLSDEDLILLLCAEPSQFTPLAEVIEHIIRLGKKLSLPKFDKQTLHRLVTTPQRELYQRLDECLGDFARCNHATLDHWADEFRVQRRLGIGRLALLLSIPADQWQKPPRQDYAANILAFFERRMANAVMRGPLVRLIISPSSARIDVAELHSPLRSADSLVGNVINRREVTSPVDPIVHQQQPLLLRRLWRLVHSAANTRRDTGIDSLYLGFPFVIAGRHEGRPRIAPLWLWPVNLQFSSGRNSNLTLNFDNERAQVRLNPALESIVGQEVLQRLAATQEELLERRQLDVREVMDAVNNLLPAPTHTLQRHPSVNHNAEDDSLSAWPSAVIFNVSFSGQAIAEDLHSLQGLPTADTALSHLLRIEENPSDDSTQTENLGEAQRYNLVPADPSQDQAVMQARRHPGTVIEGPPGTGKSQTIVNIVADCLGRRQKVLVVCQKQAALRVVEKRLEALDLQYRLLTVTDIGKDRQAVIRSVRDQLDEMARVEAASQGVIQLQREQLAKQIDALEAELNQRHTALYEIEPQWGRSYRQICSELIGLDSRAKLKTAAALELPALRTLLADQTEEQINKLIQACNSLAPDWFASHFEDSPLHCLQVFSPDAALQNEIAAQVSALQIAEQQRSESIQATRSLHPSDPKVVQSKDLRQWQQDDLQFFRTLDDDDLQRVAGWFDLFFEQFEGSSQGDDLVQRLESLQQALSELSEAFQSRQGEGQAWFEQVNALAPNKQLSLLKACKAKLSPSSWRKTINPGYWWQQIQINKFLAQLEAMGGEIDTQSLAASLELEVQLRQLRQQLHNPWQQLGCLPQDFCRQPLVTLRRALGITLQRANEAQATFAAARRCPLPHSAKNVLQAGKGEELQRFFDNLSQAERHASNVEQCQVCWSALSNWVEPDWLDGNLQSLGKNEPTTAALADIGDHLANLEPFQRFRLRSQECPPLVFKVLALFRTRQSQLQALSSSELAPALTTCIRREALLTWKQSIEAKQPLLLSDSDALEQKRQRLAHLDLEKSRLNQQWLKANVDHQAIGNQRQWNDITRLRGARYKKLREFIDLGMDIGLMDLRPVWLMSPEAVSQALPRRAGLFDVVVFDEASQMMVDFAIPSLYRAKRVVISGDEKQMPPSNFFSSAYDDDEDDGIEALEEDASEAEILQHEDAWNRREIKDCPDLLVLGKTVLPTTTLQIHYRSRYRALIDFSNHAYYAGKLHVPTLHPLAVIARDQPLQLHRVDGTYSKQTNLEEANKIVELVADTWSAKPHARPSIGIVTFNKKQAELIEDCLQSRADEDEEFQRLYLLEQNRLQQGEDMSLFVKNVENVQGDERDIIFFSTTFGYNEHGAFRRNFGALGHRGGERRLNVAVTRARHKVIIATSMPVRDISDMISSGRKPNKPRDYLQAYLEYASSMSAGNIVAARQRLLQFSGAGMKARRETINGLDDDFIQDVMDFIEQLGYQVEAGQKDDAFSLDLAVIDPSSGQFALGIECDSPTHALLGNARARDIWRKHVISQSIPFVHRLHCHRWFKANAEEKNQLRSLLEKVIA